MCRARGVQESRPGDQPDDQPGDQHHFARFFENRTENRSFDLTIRSMDLAISGVAISAVQGPCRLVDLAINLAISKPVDQPNGVQSSVTPWN